MHQLRRLVELAGGRVAPHNGDCADESVTVCLAWGQPSAARMDECSQRGHLVVRPDFIFHCIKWREDCRLLLGELQNDPTYTWTSWVVASGSRQGLSARGSANHILSCAARQRPPLPY